MLMSLYIKMGTGHMLNLNVSVKLPNSISNFTLYQEYNHILSFQKKKQENAQSVAFYVSIQSNFQSLNIDTLNYLWHH